MNDSKYKYSVSKPLNAINFDVIRILFRYWMQDHTTCEVKCSSEDGSSHELSPIWHILIMRNNIKNINIKDTHGTDLHSS